MSPPTEHAGGAEMAVGAILAGGAGSRLGGAKAMADLAGRPLLSYPLAAVVEAGLEPIVVVKRGSALPPLDCQVVHEPDRPQHPLCGIVAALRHARDRPLVVVACDMPFADAGLLEWLASAPEPLVVPSVAGRLQPLHARYDPALLPLLEAALGRAEPLQEAVASLEPRVIEEEELARFGDPRRICFNVNAAEDLERAEELLRLPAARPPGSVPRSASPSSPPSSRQPVRRSAPKHEPRSRPA